MCIVRCITKTVKRLWSSKTALQGPVNHVFWGLHAWTRIGNLAMVWMVWCTPCKDGGYVDDARSAAPGLFVVCRVPTKLLRAPTELPAELLPMLLSLLGTICCSSLACMHVCHTSLLHTHSKTHLHHDGPVDGGGRALFLCGARAHRRLSTGHLAGIPCR